MGFRERCMPDLSVKTVYDIDFRLLTERGIRGIIFDIDNTLVTYDDAVAGEELSLWLNQLVYRSDFSVAFVSNNSRARVKRFVESAGLEHPSLITRLLNLMGFSSFNPLPCYARALKPCKHCLKKACRAMRLSPSQVALVGDQVFTDILGGNRMNMFTVLVSPISDKDTKFVKWKRKWEHRIMKSE